jgi:hypothetical protein
MEEAYLMVRFPISSLGGIILGLNKNINCSKTILRRTSVQILFE